MAQRLLFGGTQGGAAAQSKYLVEFRAGKCTQKGKLVTPDKRKGMVYVHQTDDSLIHFCWKDRSTGNIEEDLIMFPGDAEFEKVSQCTTGRVFVLKFKSNSKRVFFWMQEPKTDKDDDYRTKVNQFLNDPSSSSSRGGSGGGGSIAELSDEHDLNSLISGMSQRDLLQLFGGLGGNPANLVAALGGAGRSGGAGGGGRSARGGSAAATAAAASGGGSQEAMDTEFASSAAAAPATPLSSAAAGGGGKGAGIKPQNLADILNKVNAEAAAAGGSKQVDSISGALTSPEALEPLINNAELMARVKDLLPPSGGASESADLGSQIKLTVKSPQFQQAVAMFTSALASGQMGPVMAQFGLGDDVAAAAASGNMDEFVNALEKAQKKEGTENTDHSTEDAEMKE